MSAEASLGIWSRPTRLGSLDVLERCHHELPYLAKAVSGTFDDVTGEARPGILALARDEYRALLRISDAMAAHATVEQELLHECVSQSHHRRAFVL